MTQSITLTASMRSNLSSLKSIQGQMDTTQTRLSTGKKVNSAIDNASSYYQSRSLTNRAADLDALLDSMGQGIQTIQAANEGIEAITSYLDQAKSVANSAFALDASAEDYVSQVENYQTQFNKIRTEIGKLADDASYQGINLLRDGNLTVMFNETRTNSLTVDGDDVVTKMGDAGYTDASWLGDVSAKKDALDTAVAAGAADYSATAKFTYDAKAMTFTEVTGAVDGYTGKYYTAEQKGTVETAVTNYKNAVKGVADKINESLKGITDAVSYLRDYSSELGNNFSIIETRQNFTENLIDVLETGSDNLVLADMNEESANYLALQTRQQLAINSLALASQSAQSVLSLF